MLTQELQKMLIRFPVVPISEQPDYIKALVNNFLKREGEIGGQVSPERISVNNWTIDSPRGCTQNWICTKSSEYGHEFSTHFWCLIYDQSHSTIIGARSLILRTYQEQTVIALADYIIPGCYIPQSSKLAGISRGDKRIEFTYLEN